MKPGEPMTYGDRMNDDMDDHHQEFGWLTKKTAGQKLKLTHHHEAGRLQYLLPLIMLCLDRSNESDQLLPLWELSYAETHSTSCFPVTNSQLITTARSTNDEWLKLSKRWSWFKCTHWCIRLDSLGNAPSAGPSAIFFKHTLPVVTASHLDKTLVVALHSNWLLWHQACQLKATRWNPLKTNSFRIKNSAWDTDQTIPT